MLWSSLSRQLALQVLAPFAIGLAVFLSHLVAVSAPFHLGSYHDWLVHLVGRKAHAMQMLFM